MSSQTLNTNPSGYFWLDSYREALRINSKDATAYESIVTAIEAKTPKNIKKYRALSVEERQDYLNQLTNRAFEKFRTDLEKEGRRQLDAYRPHLKQANRTLYHTLDIQRCNEADDHLVTYSDDCDESNKTQFLSTLRSSNPEAYHQLKIDIQKINKTKNKQNTYVIPKLILGGFAALSLLIPVTWIAITSMALFLIILLLISCICNRASISDELIKEAMQPSQGQIE